MGLKENFVSYFRRSKNCSPEEAQHVAPGQDMVGEKGAVVTAPKVTQEANPDSDRRDQMWNSFTHGDYTTCRDLNKQRLAEARRKIPEGDLQQQMWTSFLYGDNATFRKQYTQLLEQDELKRQNRERESK